MNKDVIFNFMMDLRKREINKFEQAQIIKDYLKSTGSSFTDVAYKLGITKIKLEEWLLLTKITEEDYKRLKFNGLSDAEIYELLKNNKNIETESLIEQTRLDYDINEIKKIAHSLLHTFKKEYVTKNSDKMVFEVIDMLNRLRMKIDISGKKVRTNFR